MKLSFRNIVMAVIGIAFVIPAGGMAVDALRGVEGISESENRVLAGVPRFQGSAQDFTAEFDEYLEDNFGFRMSLIRLSRKVKDNLGENPEEVVFGKDGWLFLGEPPYRDEFEGVGYWSDAQVDRWVTGLSDLNTALAERDIPFAAFIGVDKARIYPEKLPDDWTWGRRRFRTFVHSHPDIARTGVIDAEPYILAAKEMGEKAFWERDTHWTPDGTHDLALALLDQLDPERTRPRYQPDPPRLKTAGRILDLEKMAGAIRSQEPEYLMIDIPPVHDGFLVTRPPASDDSPKRGQFSTWEIEGTKSAPKGRLVIVGDSFGDAILEHLRVSYSEIIRLHHGAQYFDVTFEDVVAEDPDAVLYATAERQAFRKDNPIKPIKR